MEKGVTSGISRGCLKGFQRREAGPGKPLQVIMKQKPGTSPSHPPINAATGPLQIVNRPQGDLSGLKVLVQRLRGDVRRLYVMICELQRTLRGKFAEQAPASRSRILFAGRALTKHV
jgi:hypothetical protein